MTPTWEYLQLTYHYEAHKALMMLGYTDTGTTSGGQARHRLKRLRSRTESPWLLSC
jgi:hypothetical protein